jgi:hypothetical protein
LAGKTRQSLSAKRQLVRTPGYPFAVFDTPGFRYPQLHQGDLITPSKKRHYIQFLSQRHRCRVNDIIVASKMTLPQRQYIVIASIFTIAHQKYTEAS